MKNRRRVLLDFDESAVQRWAQEVNAERIVVPGLSICEMPEDDSWYYYAIRPSLPAFMAAMAANGVEVGIFTSGEAAYTQLFVERIGLTEITCVYGGDSVIKDELAEVAFVLVDDLDPQSRRGPIEKLFQAYGHDPFSWKGWEENARLDQLARQLVDKHFVKCAGFRFLVIQVRERGLKVEEADKEPLTGLADTVLTKLRAQCA